MGMGSRQGGGMRPLAIVVVLLATSMVTVSGREEPMVRYRSAPERPIATTAEGLRSQRQVFRVQLDVVQAEIGRLNRAIDAQRKILAHEYGELDDEVMWDAATISVPDLVRMLEPLVPPLDDTD